MNTVLPFTSRPPTGRRFARLSVLPAGQPVPSAADADGMLRAQTASLGVSQMLRACYI